MFVTFCVSFVFVLVCIHILYLCAVCRKVIEPHDTSGSSHNLLRLLSNSTPHRSKPTLSLPQYRGLQNTECGGIQNTEEYLQTREPAMKQSTVIIKFNLTSIWCHVAVLRTKTRYRIVLWKSKWSIAKPKNPPTTNEGRGATLKFTSLPSAPPDATEMLWEVLNRSNSKRGIQNTKARSECTTV